MKTEGEGDEAKMLKHEPCHESFLQSLTSDSKNRIAVTEDVKLDNRDIKVEVSNNQDNQFHETGENQLILYRRGEDPRHDHSEAGTVSAHQQNIAMLASQARQADLEARETILRVREGEDRCHGGAPQSEEGHLVGERGSSVYLD
jgi:hypothetical protein